MCSGVLKSGSPSVKSYTLMPRLLSALALAAAAIVAEGLSDLTAGERFISGLAVGEKFDRLHWIIVELAAGGVKVLRLTNRSHRPISTHRVVAQPDFPRCKSCDDSGGLPLCGGLSRRM